MNRLPFVCLLAALLAGCAATPPERPPEMAVPPTFIEAQVHAGTAWRPGQPAQADVPDDWWRRFDDPVLAELQTRVRVDNETLRNALAQLRAAEGALGASRAALWPVVTGSLASTRSRAAGSEGVQGSLTDSRSLSASASWEPDLWGRLGGTVDASRARVQASQSDLLAARLSVQATLAQTYFALRAAEAQADAVERSVTAYRRTLELTQHRQAAGVVSSADVAQAQTQLRSAEAQGLELRTQRAQLAHAIAVLLGQPPAALSLAPTARLPAAPEVPELLPAALLQRRPDIAAAERRVAAAQAQIGVTRASFFPMLTLSANAGYKASDWRDLLDLPHRFWSFGPSLALALFDAGARQAATEQALAAADQAASSYRQTVLTAFQEVEDNLVAASNLREEERLQAEALAAARRALDIALAQYRGGTVSYLSVTAAQTSALSVERSLIDVRNRRLAAVAQLFKNAAGRWDLPQDQWRGPMTRPAPAAAEAAADRRAASPPAARGEEGGP